MQALRCCGFNVLTMNYSGSQGSEGDFLFDNVLDDTKTALRFIKDNASEYHVVTNHGKYLADCIQAKAPADFEYQYHSYPHHIKSYHEQVFRSYSYLYCRKTILETICHMIHY